MLTVALVLAGFSTAANLFATALAGLFGEEAMMGLFALAAGLSGIGLVGGFHDPALLLLLMPAATLASIAAVAPLALGYAHGQREGDKAAGSAETRAAPESDSRSGTAARAQKGAWDFLPMSIPVAPPMLSSLAALLA